MSLKPLGPSFSVSTSDPDQGQRTYRIVIAVLIILFCVVLIRRAWICDDAYITFRTVDNFIHGYRLTWNVSERVQAFTNPLWMFVLSLPYFFTHEIYITSLVVSILLAIAVLIILSRKLAVSTVGAAFVLLVLTLSKAYMDFSTSGLENSLSHLLIVIFFAIYFLQTDSIRKFFFLSLVASFGIFNRMDMAVVFAPALIYSFWKVRSKRAFWMGVLGQLPFILWELFAIWYYGFPFPNTAYAKLNTGIPQVEYVQQGFLYLLNSIQFDPITLVSVAAGLAAAWMNKDRRNLWLAAGLLAYLAYVVKVGGDFMSGRFLTIPLICAAILLVRFDFNRLTAWGTAILYGAALVLAFSVSNPTIHITDSGDINRGPVHIGSNGILDERMLYYGGTGLLNIGRQNSLPNFYWGIYGEAAKNEGKAVADNYGIGLYGFYAGPSVYVLDKLALADPLLARIPARRMVNWRIGHMERILPANYLDTLNLKRNAFIDPHMKLYYDKLSDITRGSLTDPKRLVEIWKMNTGQYNYLIDGDKYQYPTMVFLKAAQAKKVLPNATACSAANVYKMDDSGMEIQLGSVWKSNWLQIGLDHDDRYQIVYFNGKQELARQDISTAYLTDPGGISARIIQVPAAAAQKGFDRVRIFPTQGSEPYCLGYLTRLQPAK